MSSRTHKGILNFLSAQEFHDHLVAAAVRQVRDSIRSGHDGDAGCSGHRGLILGNPFQAARAKAFGEIDQGDAPAVRKCLYSRAAERILTVIFGGLAD